MSTLFEIIELPNGDIALQRADENGEPVVSIRFSKESEFFLDEAKLDVAKVMIEAGLELVGAIDFPAEEETVSDESVTLH